MFYRTESYLSLSLKTDRKYNTLTAPEPPGKEHLKKIREEMKYRKQVKEMIKEFCYYALFVLLISLIAFGQRDGLAYTMNQGVINTLGIPEFFYEELTFKQVRACAWILCAKYRIFWDMDIPRIQEITIQTINCLTSIINFPNITRISKPKTRHLSFNCRSWILHVRPLV